MKRTISCLVRSRAGVLAEMTEAFSRMGLNIRSIAAGETHRPEVYRMVIIVDASDEETTRIFEEMQAMDFVIRVEDLAREEFLDRELVMVKAVIDRETASRVIQVLEVFRAGIIDMGETSITAELSGTAGKIDGLIRALTPYGIRCMCRTGTIALKRGDEE